MIKNFTSELEMRDSAIIYEKMIEQAQEIYETMPNLFGEFCYSCMELALTGSLDLVSSDNPFVRLMLKGYEKSVEKAYGRYKAKLDISRIKQEEELQLYEIARGIYQGKSQKEIANELGVSESTITYRKKIIYEKYPYLMNPKTFEDPKFVQLTPEDFGYTDEKWNEICENAKNSKN